MGFVKDGADDLDEFLDRVHEQIIDSPVVHFDEPGERPRALLAIIEQHAEQQSWASQIDALLRALHEEVKAAKATGQQWLDP